VAEADRAVDDAHVVLGQFEALGLAVGGRPLAQVDDRVVDRSVAAADELGDAVAELEVHPRTIFPAEREWLSWTHSPEIPISANLSCL